MVVDMNKILPLDLRYEFALQMYKKEINALRIELALYKKYCKRPVIIKEVIHHLAKGRTSSNLYGTAAYDEYVYE